MATTDPLLRALAHPVRLRIVSLVWNVPLSAAELSRELGISHALASQHLRRLDAVGLVELAEVRANRGGRERRYRAVHGSPLSDQRHEGARLIAEAMAHNLRERAARRLPGAEGVTSDAELWVAPEVWTDFRNRLAALFDGLHDAARAPHAPGTVGIGATVMAFPLAEPDSTHPDSTHPSDAGPGDAGPGDAGPRDAGPGDAGPRDAGPGDAGPRDAGPGDAHPDSTHPDSTELAAPAPDIPVPDAGGPDDPEERP